MIPGNWTEQTDYGRVSGNTGANGIPILGNSCVSNASYLYCVGGQNLSTGVDISNVYYAYVAADGTIGSWNETTDYAAATGSSGGGGVGVEFTSCVSDLGYVYCVAGAASNTPNIRSAVYYARLSSTGVGPWTETTDFGATSTTNGSGGVATFSLACAAAGSDVYCTGGSSSTSKVYYASLSSSGVGAWTETTDYGAASGSSGSGGVSISNDACAVNGSFLYCVGGQVAFHATSKGFLAPVNASGVGAWNETTDYGATSGSSGTGGNPIWASACFTYSGQILCADGDNATNVGTDLVYVAQVSSTGIGPWTAGPAYGDLPLVSYHLVCAVARAFGLCTGGGSPQTFGSSLQPSLTLTTTLSSTSVVQHTTFFDTARLSGPGAATATGTVTYTQSYGGRCDPANQTAAANVSVSGGVVPNSPAFTAVIVNMRAEYSVLAVYSGDATHPKTAATCEPYNATGPTLTTNLSAASVLIGQTFSDAATLAGATASAGGRVFYTLYTDESCFNQINTTTVAVTNGAVPNSPTYTSRGTPSGYMSIQAYYTGDPNNLNVFSACEPILVNMAKPSLTTQLSSASVAVGGTFTDTATLQGATSDAHGTVDFTTYSDGVCGNSTGQAPSGGLVTNGVVSPSGPFTAVAASSGYNSVVAFYGGDGKNSPARAVCERIAVTPATPKTVTVTISCTPDAVSAGSPVNCTVTVTGFTGSVAGEQVTLSTDSATGRFSPAAHCTLTAAGTCSVTYTDTSAPFPTLRASYPGDASNSPAASATVIGNLPTPPKSSAASSTSISVGSVSADQTATTGVSVAISGSSASDGTPVTIFSAELSTPPTGTPASSLTDGPGFYDVKVVGIDSGTATICISSAKVDPTTVVQYDSGGAWASASGLTVTPGAKVCGDIPVSSLNGTVLDAGDAPSPGTSSPLYATELAILVVVVIVVIATLLVLWRRRGRPGAISQPKPASASDPSTSQPESGS